MKYKMSDQLELVYFGKATRARGSGGEDPPIEHKIARLHCANMPSIAIFVCYMKRSISL